MTYSKTVYVLKIVLPLIALGMLASLFLLSRSQMDAPVALPFSASDLDARIREQRIADQFTTERIRRAMIFRCQRAKSYRKQRPTAQGK